MDGDEDATDRSPKDKAETAIFAMKMFGKVAKHVLKKDDEQDLIEDTDRSATNTNRNGNTTNQGTQGTTASTSAQSAAANAGAAGVSSTAESAKL